MTAQNSAQEAMNKAGSAADLANKDSEEIKSLRQVVSNLDDYKQVSDLTIPFAFNKYTLTEKDRQDLDNLVANALSRKRADAVTEYLVAKHDIPIYRIHMIGLGEEKPLDDGHTRAARAKNRRVEIKIFSADASYSTSQADRQSSSQQPQSSSQQAQTHQQQSQTQQPQQ